MFALNCVLKRGNYFSSKGKAAKGHVLARQLLLLDDNGGFGLISFLRNH